MGGQLCRIAAAYYKVALTVDLGRNWKYGLFIERHSFILYEQTPEGEASSNSWLHVDTEVYFTA